MRFESVYFSPKKDNGLVYEYQVVDESDGNTHPDMNLEIIEYELEEEIKSKVESHWFNGGGY